MITNCPLCGAKFNATLISWTLENRSLSVPIGEVDPSAYWQHDCEGPQETVGDYLYRIDKEYREQRDRQDKNRKGVK